MVQQQLAERFAKRGACNKNIDFAEDISRTVFTDKNAVVDARTELTRWNYEAGREVRFESYSCICNEFTCPPSPNYNSSKIKGVFTVPMLL